MNKTQRSFHDELRDPTTVEIITLVPGDVVQLRASCSVP
jgi:hypothetical protein